MTDVCHQIHTASHLLPRHRFPYEDASIPRNGIYMLFEVGEHAHGGDRIVRIGSHTGQNKLHSRLREHFLTENKDRSIFRKNIGRALLTRSDDPFLEQWNWDLTSSKAKAEQGPLVNLEKLEMVEQQVTRTLQQRFSFVVIAVDQKADRLSLEAGLIAAIAQCRQCGPSATWLGSLSPKPKISESGLWQEQHLAGLPLSPSQLAEFLRTASEQHISVAKKVQS